MERANEVLWDTSVVKIIFKNEMIARKYRTKVETFLKDTLENGEDFIVNCQIQDNVEQECNEVSESFHIDKTNTSLNEKPHSEGIPHYSSAFEDVLHCNDLQTEEKRDEEKETKAQVVTCFNCLGNHHMKQCPEEIDRLRIAANKKDILLGNTMRYHVEEQKNSMKPGILSPELRKALGVRNDQLPPFIYHMRVLGYPPGWMDEAVLETSGISLYDVDGKDIKDGAAVLSKETIYDGTKFINYPGFNTATPQGINDEWEALKMPPIQPHQQLIEALKSPNTVVSNYFFY
ncbi:zinc finger CCHC domain-containing protein 8-like [Uloborus diversus]|uniref:zinc finger CCHC domain-containing protein 8-like n=1 Tax=Uloborus diversus TaxID=327109 RepID=UPI00240A9B8D|nr:zinc finger CCHC domain-containing protein 8-like [Uloborus diversus]